MDDEKEAVTRRGAIYVALGFMAGGDSMKMYQVMDWDTGALPLEDRVVMRFQYKDKPIQNADAGPWTEFLLLNPEQARELIKELQHRLEGLG